MSRQPRFEIVRSDAEQPWHARFVASNGRILWVTENYARRRGAQRAVDAIAYRQGSTELRYVDERTP